MRNKRWIGVLAVLILLALIAIWVVYKLSTCETVNLAECVLEGDRIEAQSGDGRRVLLRDGDVLLRIEGERIDVEKIKDGRLRVTAAGSRANPQKVGVLMTGGEANEARLNCIHTIAAANPATQTFYILQKGWDKGLVAIPTALVLPRELSKKPKWRYYRWTHGHRRFEYVDEYDRKYVLPHVMWSGTGEGEFPDIIGLKRYRPDGTLECESNSDEVAHAPSGASFYGIDGKTRIGYVVIDWDWSRRNPPFVKELVWRDENGDHHEFDANDQSVIRFEWAGELDKNGMFSIKKLLNGRNDLDKAVFELDLEQAVGDIENPLLK